VTKLVEIPHIVAASAAFPASSIPELIAAAKKAPGKINYGSAGIGKLSPPRHGEVSSARPACS